MLFAALAFLASCERIFHTLDKDNWKDTMAAHEWVLVRFFSQHQEQSVRSFDDYNLVGRSFENTSLYVAGMDCGKYRRECLRHKIFDFPAVKLYNSKTGEEYKYDGGFSFESIIQWATNISKIEAGHVTQLVATPNGRTFREMIANERCVLAFFHTPWCGACKRFMPRLNRVARLFRDVPEVKFAAVDADRYRSFLREWDLKTYPEIRLFVRGEKKGIEFEGKRSPILVTEFINKHCGTKKDASSMEAEAGLIDEANTVVEEFLMSGRKEMYVQKMKTVPRASYYVAVMEGMLAHGDEYLLEQKSKWLDMIALETTSPKEKEICQKKVNIIAYFQELLATLN